MQGQNHIKFPDIILSERKLILQIASSWKRFCDSCYNSPRYIPSSFQNTH